MKAKMTCLVGLFLISSAAIAADVDGDLDSKFYFGSTGSDFMDQAYCMKPHANPTVEEYPLVERVVAISSFGSPDETLARFSEAEGAISICNLNGQRYAYVSFYPGDNEYGIIFALDGQGQVREIASIGDGDLTYTFEHRKTLTGEVDPEVIGDASVSWLVDAFGRTVVVMQSGEFEDPRATAIGKMFKKARINAIHLGRMHVIKDRAVVNELRSFSELMHMPISEDAIFVEYKVTRK